MIAPFGASKALLVDHRAATDRARMPLDEVFAFTVIDTIRGKGIRNSR